MITDKIWKQEINEIFQSEKYNSTIFDQSVFNAAFPNLDM